MNQLLAKIARPGRALAAGVFALSASLLAAPAIAPELTSAQAQSRSAELDRAVAALRGISTMRADFSQTDRQGNLLKGTLTLKRGGKIRFDYGKDAEMLVVSNGKSLYFVDYEVGQVERYPIQRSPLGALLDPSRDVSRYGELMPTGSSEVLSILVKDPKKPEYGTINLIFVSDPRAPGGLQLTHWVALDAQNYRTTVRLTNHRYGMDVAESAFSFEDPRRTSRRRR
ncbi:MAG: outer membrane lipoprotein carrier protein LolA [Erythrobacter sp.]|nr:outer membrane lipoprotein carrier protein LolA [Erythrobacter sp.]